MEVISITDSNPIVARTSCRDCISISSSSSVSSSSSSSSDSTPFAFDFSYLLTGEDSSVEEESVGRFRPRVPRSFVLSSTVDDETNEEVPVVTAPSSESSAILEEGAVAISESNHVPDTMLSEIARELHNSNSSLLLTEEDESMICRAMCNTKRYEDSNKHHLYLQAFGSTAMNSLLEDVSYDNGGIPTKEMKVFYILWWEKMYP